MSQASPSDDARWALMTEQEAVASLTTDPEAGLSAAESAHRLETYGPNQLQEKPPVPKWKVFLSQFKDFMIYVLIVAVIIAAVEGQVVEAVAILAILLLNGVLGFVQEYRAEQALEALKRMSAPMATVIRGGVEREVPAAELVPGDIVMLEAGDTVPADGRLLEVGALRTIESALTGESEAVQKRTAPVAAPVDGAGEALAIPLGDMRDMVFSGTSVSVGHGKMVVVATGQKTEMGKIATMLNETEDDQTPIQVELDRVGKRIAIAVLVIAAAVFVEEMFVSGQFTEGLLVAVSLAVAAIPEGLPAIVTVALSLGVRRMAEHNAIVKKLHAVETLGSTDYICSDKTGTLTLNKMSARRVLVGLTPARVEGNGVELIDETSDAVDPGQLRLLIEIGLACNDAHYTAEDELVGDPTETALVAAARELEPTLQIPERVAEVPFDSERKRMTTVHATRDSAGERTLIAMMKGGMDTTLPLCTGALIDGKIQPMTDEIRAQIATRNADFAAGGFRTLAFATRALPEDINLENESALEADMTYVGIIALQDPARPEVPASVKTAHDAGISVAMVTGDHALTAQAIAREIGILGDDAPEGSVVSGPEIEAMSDDELRNRVESIRVYARVNPEHKLRIVDALKSRNHIVAMTGDGVNDAPALKRADIGVAMGKVGTDVTREAADMVLADDNFSTIVKAVGLGRNVFDNLKKVILFLLSCNISEVFIISLTTFFSTASGMPALLPLQILWINLITDGLPALALGVDPAEDDVMERKPRNASEPILTGTRWFQIGWQGFVLSIFPLLLGYWIAPDILHTNGATARTMLFTTLVLSQLLHTFSFRSESHSIFSLKRTFANKWLLMAFGGSMFFQLLLIYIPETEKLFNVTPLTLADWVAVIIVSLMSIAVIDVVKLISARKTRAQSSTMHAQEV